MNLGAIFWLMLLAVSAILFFGVAAVVTVRGARELGELLKGKNVEKPLKPPGGTA